MASKKPPPAFLAKKAPPKGKVSNFDNAAKTVAAKRAAAKKGVKDTDKDGM